MVTAAELTQAFEACAYGAEEPSLAVVQSPWYFWLLLEREGLSGAAGLAYLLRVFPLLTDDPAVLAEFEAWVAEQATEL